MEDQYDARQYQHQQQSKSSSSNRYIPSDVKQRVWRRDGLCCVKCGSTKKLAIHHITPVAKGGDNTERNLQLLCEYCHQKQHAKIPAWAKAR